MAANSSRVHSPKLCPRCGAFYQDLASQTCPQCFARLEPLTDAEAANLIAEQEARSRDPEYVQLKRVEDEKFKEQSFGACFGVALILLATLIVSVVAVIIVAHHRRSVTAPPSAAVRSTTTATTPLPTDFDRVIPQNIAGQNRTAGDANLALPGTLTRVYHGVYGGAAQVYAVTGPATTDDKQLSILRLSVSVALQQHQPGWSEQEVSTAMAHYIVIAPNADLRALAARLPQR